MRWASSAGLLIAMPSALKKLSQIAPTVIVGRPLSFSSLLRASFPVDCRSPSTYQRNST